MLLPSLLKLQEIKSRSTFRSRRIILDTRLPGNSDSGAHEALNQGWYLTGFHGWSSLRWRPSRRWARRCRLRRRSEKRISSIKSDRSRDLNPQPVTKRQPDWFKRHRGSLNLSWQVLLVQVTELRVLLGNYLLVQQYYAYSSLLLSPGNTTRASSFPSFYYFPKCPDSMHL